MLLALWRHDVPMPETVNDLDNVITVGVVESDRRHSQW